MKHIFLLLVLIVVGYFAYIGMDSPTRRAAARQVAIHGIRLTALVVLLGGIVLAAVHLSATPLF